MFKTLRKLVRIAYGDDLPPVERWAMRHANKCSADEIIAAAVIQSMAKDISAYSLSDFSIRCADRKKDLNKPSAELKGPKVVVIFERSGWIRGKSRDNDGIRPWKYHPDGRIVKVVVDGVSIRPSIGAEILSRYRRLSKVLTASQQVAAKAKADMERNEKAWNLAEKLLGMKRNEHGALVPVKTVEDEHSCGCDFGECCQFCDPEEEA
jgi:hypothetical protein